MASAPIRVAVIGVGAFGRNHLRVYRELELAHPDLVRLTAFVDANPKTRDETAARLGIPAYASVEQLLASPHLPDAASICVPTIHHASTAETLLRGGVDVLIEKPFASSLAEADHILALANSTGRILQIGHLERFNPAVTATIARLNRPMFFEAHRLSIFTPRSLDVDVVLDLMIHDLDIVLALTQSPVKEVRAVGLPILSSKIDIANVRIELNNGCVANFTASRVSTEQVRKIRLFQPQQYLSLDFARQELLSINVDPAAAALIAAHAAGASLSGSPLSGSPLSGSPLSGTALPPMPTPGAPSALPTWSGIRKAASFFTSPPATASAGPTTTATPTNIAHPSAGLTLDKCDIVKGEPLRLELEDFLNSVRHRTPPRVTGEAGLAALALALEITQQIASHSKRAGLT